MKPKSENLKNQEQAFDELKHIISDTTSKIIPRKSKRKKQYKLPIMNENILHALKRKKIALFEWKQQGQPREANNYDLNICQENTTHEEVSIQELKQAINKLNMNKAMDCYGFTAENFIHASQSRLEYLQLLINTSFEQCYIPNTLKIGTIFPVFKTKGDIKNAKNYRGITVKPTYSKIIEIILKDRENNEILKHQNPLQKDFTAKSTPLLCELFIEEFEWENKDLKLPTYIALLDGKSAFDVVVHTN
ncbi:unnamed protein product [Mytilus coruscus]|uniref:Reverse transcriptase domain-containing protein n=1 Tax=Mytilus coruscus TaxID=42192 RepID=A0A6J8ELV4_MYTCO|nr:unnamed protein product [Mytilus coruscus]